MAGFKKLSQLRTIIPAMLLAVGAAITMPLTATAATLKVTIENEAPTNGVGLGHFWLGFHDGSFDFFNPGEPASNALKLLAQQQVVGLGARILAEVDVPLPQLTAIVINTFQAGTDYSFLSPPLQAALEADADPTVISALVNDVFTSGIDFNKLPPSVGTIADVFAKSQAAQNGGSQDILFVSTLEPVPFVQFPGTKASRTIEIGDPAKNRFFSYGTQVFPSQDSFIGNDDPKAIEIFNDKGDFLGANFIVFGNQVWDAGIDEQGKVRLANNPDLSVPGYQIARITITQVDEPDNIKSLFASGGLLLIMINTSRIKREKGKFLANTNSLK